jgi:hypothetical protein
MIEVLAVLAALGLLIGVAYLLDRRRKKRGKEDISWMIPHQILGELFALHELRYVDPGIIPGELREKGWMSQTFQKELKVLRHASLGMVRKMLRQKGWEIKTRPVELPPRSILQKFAHTIFPLAGSKSSGVEVFHAIIGPNDRGESVVVRHEHVVLRWVDINSASGELERHFTDVWHDHKVSDSIEPCSELFDTLDKLSKRQPRRLA